MTKVTRITQDIRIVDEGEEHVGCKYELETTISECRFTYTFDIVDSDEHSRDEDLAALQDILSLHAEALDQSGYDKLTTMHDLPFYLKYIEQWLEHYYDDQKVKAGARS